MLFNSFPFIFLFLPIALIGYFSLNHFKFMKGAKLWLVTASLFFYSYFTYKNLPLLIGSILINFFLSQAMRNESFAISKKALIRIGLVFNIGLLCFFKYGGDWVLPLGISFFTLQQIAFLIDTYEGLADEKNLLDYAVFVTFFPQLVSGPIVHYQHLMPQIQDSANKRFHREQFQRGLFLFVIGLVKKVLISEAFAGWAKMGFDHLEVLDLLGAWKASLAYTFQLYYDFSGYTDMAIGIACMFNVHLPQNFNSPFRSKSVIEFWTRWHMTLSQFINTYVFTPLVRAMPKINFQTTMIATFSAMFLAGIWHGSGWTFVIYGTMHGAALVVNHLLKKNKKRKKFPEWLAWLMTFTFVNFSFVVFRAKTLADALKVYKGMLGFSGVTIPKIGIKSVGPLKEYGFKMGPYLVPDDYFYLVLFAGCLYAVLKLKNSLELEKSFVPSDKLAVLCGVAFALCLFGMNRVTEFIYFNF